MVARPGRGRLMRNADCSVGVTRAVASRESRDLPHDIGRRQSSASRSAGFGVASRELAFGDAAARSGTDDEAAVPAGARVLAHGRS
jgi:hypothetical protein